MSEVDILIELQVRRKFFIKTIIRQINAARSLVARALGWDPNAPEAEREKIKAKAAKVIKKAFDGKGCDLPGLETDLEVIAQSIGPLERMRHGVELEMRKIVRSLPIWKAFGEAVRGLGDLGLAVIIAETGDLSKYAGPDKVKRRLGIAPFTKDGLTMALSNWRKKGGLSADDWIAAKYNPRRRAEIYSCVGDPLFRQQTVTTGPYRLKYDARRARTAITHTDWTKGHSHDDAVRVMTQKLLVDLWCAWNGRASRGMNPIEVLPSQPIAEAA